MVMPLNLDSHSFRPDFMYPCPTPSPRIVEDSIPDIQLLRCSRDPNPIERFNPTPLSNFGRSLRKSRIIKKYMSQVDICVNEGEVVNSTISLSSKCVASWDLTGDQLLVSLYGMCAVVSLAGIWVVAARFSARKDGEYTFSRRIRVWAKQSQFAIIMNRPVQLAVSICILCTFVVRLATYTVTAASYHILTGLYFVSFIDDVIRFFASRYKLRYVFSPYVVLEIVCISSHLVLGYGDSRIVNGVSSRTWLDFSVLRSIFIYRSFTEMEQNFTKGLTKAHLVFRWFVKSLLLIVFAAGVMFLLETLGELPFFVSNGFAHIYQCDNGTLTEHESTGCSEETWSVMFSFYFTVVVRIYRFFI